MNFIKICFVLVIAICVMGCGHVKPRFFYTHRDIVKKEHKVIPIYIDKDFGGADIVEIDKAVSEWNYALNGQLELKIVDFYFDMEISKIKAGWEDGGIFILKIDSLNYMVHDASPVELTLGFVDDIGGHLLYVVRDRVNVKMEYGVVLHEMGHLLGAKHTAAKGLMSRTYNMDYYQCVDFYSIESVAEYHGLDGNYMNYCIYSD